MNGMQMMGSTTCGGTATTSRTAVDWTDSVDGELENEYTYDANGNMTDRCEYNQDTEEYEVYEHTYNVENRLASIIKYDGITCAAPGSVAFTWKFAYDGDGVRVKEEYFIGDNSTPAYTKLSLFGGLYEVKVDGINVTTKKYYTIAGMRVAMRDGTNLFYFASDHLSSASLMMNASGTAVSEQRYLPFGEVRTIPGLTSITQTDFGYTGQRNYTYINLLDYGARWYSPRWDASPSRIPLYQI